jgi:predicted  nucleic acid-binding Zn-ribbon protein
MKTDTKSLSEVVVTGFGGSQIKREMTGNIARVKGKDIEFMPTPSVDAALQGRASAATGVIRAFIDKTTQVVQGRFSDRLTAARSKVTTASKAITAAKNDPTYKANQEIIKQTQSQIAGYNKQISRIRLDTQSIDAEIQGYQNNIKAIQEGISNQYDKQISDLKTQIDDARRNIEISFDRPIEALQKEINDIQKRVEEEFSRPLEDLQEALSDIEREIDIQFGRPIEGLQRESAGLSDELSYIDNISQSINDKYDAQEKALQQIKSANEDISNIEKQRLSIADALTSGDIAAASRAIQEARAQAAARAQENAGGVIDAARNAELQGVRSARGRTRKELEERQRSIEAQIKEIENARYAYEIEKDVLGIKDQIYALEEQRKDALLAIRPIQDEILKLEKDRELALDAIIKKEEQVLKLEQERAAAMAQAQAKIEAEEAKIKDAEFRKAALDKQIADLEAKILKAEQDLKYQKAVDDLEAADLEIEKLQSELDAANDAIAALEAAMAAEIEEATKDAVKALYDAELALAEAFLKAIDKSGDFKKSLNDAKNAAAEAAESIAKMFSAATGSAGDGATTRVMTGAELTASRGYISSSYFAGGNRPEIAGTNAQSGSKANPIAQLADSLKSAKEPAEAVAKAQEFFAKSTVTSEPLQKNIAAYLKAQSSDIKTMADAYKIIIDLLMIIAPLVKSYSSDVVSSVTSLNPQPSLWERIKDFVSQGVERVNAYVQGLQAALGAANSISSAIASLDRTVTTTHIIKTINISEDANVGLGSGSSSGSGKGFMYGGKIKPMAFGGRIGSDSVPAMLTPGEFVMNKAASKSFGPLLNALNESKYPSMIAKKMSEVGQSQNFVSQSYNQPTYSTSNPTTVITPVQNNMSSMSDNSNTVYNYSVGINVGGTSASPDRIAKAVLNEIKYIDSQRIRGQRK